MIVESNFQLNKLKDSGKYLTDLLYFLKQKVKPGISLLEIEHYAQIFLIKYNLKSAFR